MPSLRLGSLQQDRGDLKPKNYNSINLELPYSQTKMQPFSLYKSVFMHLCTPLQFPAPKALINISDESNLILGLDGLLAYGLESLKKEGTLC